MPSFENPAPESADDNTAAETATADAQTETPEATPETAPVTDPESASDSSINSSPATEPATEVPVAEPAAAEPAAAEPAAEAPAAEQPAAEEAAPEAAASESGAAAEPVAKKSDSKKSDSKKSDSKKSDSDKAAAGRTEAGSDAERVTFADLGLAPKVLEAITAVGYETPSAIQAATIPTLLSGRDVVGLAQTGTGKTAAFALPILSRIEPGQGVPQALVLAPTRELALQVCEAFESFAAKLPDVHLLPVYGGQAYGQQLSALRRGVDIVVGTPGRIMDHLKRGSLDLTQIKYLVLDEADEMLKMGFAEDVETILADTPQTKQVALFSATMPNQIRRISQQYLNDPREVKIAGKTQTSANITQRYIVVSYMQKLDALTRVLEVEDFDGVIVFTRTRGDSEQVAEKLRARGYSAAAINGDVAQNVREKTVQSLKDGRLDILVATDVAARGLDVERISHVVNFDLPIDTESYVHRIGRTGRAGRSGDAISFVTPRERRMLGSIEKATKQSLTQMPLPRIEDVNATRLTRFDDAITAALGETTRIERFREIIDHYVRHHDVVEADVAAALAVVSQGKTKLLLDEADDQKFARDRQQAARFLEDGGDRGGRDDRGGRERREPREQRSDLQMYRIEVGRRQKVQPGQIIGAIANEGGLTRGDFGRIQVRDDFSLVELPKGLSQANLSALADTRISGKLIELKVDSGGPGRGDRGGDRGGRGGYDRGDRGGYRGGNDRGDRGGYGNDRGDRGGYRGRDDRGGNDRGYGSDRGDRGDRGGYGSDRGDRGGYRGRDDRGGNDRGYGSDRGDRGGYRGRDDRGDRGFGGDRGGNDRGYDRGDGKRKPRW